MVDFNKLKSLGTELLGKANEFAHEAKEKAGPLAEQAKEKAGPLAEKAKDAAHRGFDKAADGIDSATGGKYSDKIDTVQNKVGSALTKDKAAPVVTPEATFYDPSGVVTETIAEPSFVTEEPPVVTDLSEDLTETIADKLGEPAKTYTDKAEPASPTV